MTKINKSDHEFRFEVCKHPDGNKSQKWWTIDIRQKGSSELLAHHQHGKRSKMQEKNSLENKSLVMPLKYRH